MTHKILVTGCGGSGGSFFCEHVLENYPEVELSGFVRWHSTSSEKNLRNLVGKVKILEVDLADFSSVFSAIKSIRPDSIVHFAASANVKSSFVNPLSVLQNNIQGTANLLEATRLVSLDIKVLLISTSEVYGQVDPKNVPITELCPLNPASPYGVSKVTQDLLGNVYHMAYKLPVIRTRMFCYLNPRRSDLFATSFALQIARIEAGKQSILKHGNLDSMRTIIDVRDAMSAYWAALKKGVPGEVYNVGGTETITVRKFLQLLREGAGCSIPILQDPNLMRPADVTLQVPDCSKFLAATGWTAKYSFNESVEYLLNECRKQVSHEQT